MSQKSTLFISITNRTGRRMQQHLLRRHRETEALAWPICFVDGSAKSLSTKLETIALDRNYLRRIRQLRAKTAIRPVRDLAKGHTDLVLLTVFAQIKTLSFDYAWLVEDDVDYSGDWGEFLRPYTDDSSDLLCANLRGTHDDPDWGWWSQFFPPKNIPPEGWRAGYLPIFRASHRLISRFVDATPQWHGHYEAIWPTAALHWGYRLNDLNDNGRIRPAYKNSNLGSAGFAPGTLVWRPPRRHAYFHEDARHFEIPDMLYHPVKNGLSVRERIMGSRLVAVLKSVRRLVLGMLK
jgi:hypothetical protein